MPKAGFKSITVSENIYNEFHTQYEKKKDELGLKGISSFLGYITSQLVEKLQQENKKHV
ncbi:MAG: hypothetical protein HRO68_07635 [Nitrosopumilus sp.]|nr:hypothetical protein [Nitrosopumilus sp.]